MGGGSNKVKLEKCRERGTSPGRYRGEGRAFQETGKGPEAGVRVWKQQQFGESKERRGLVACVPIRCVEKYDGVGGGGERSAGEERGEQGTELGRGLRPGNWKTL